MTKVIAEEIQHSTLVRAPHERVYDGIATAEGMDGWFTSGATVDANADGEIRFRWKDWGPDRVTFEDGGTILEARRPERFVFQWHPDNASYATTVEIDFEETEGGTIIRLKESGYQDTPGGRRKMLECAAGWREALTLWKFYVERGIRY